MDNHRLIGYTLLQYNHAQFYDIIDRRNRIKDLQEKSTMYSYGSHAWIEATMQLAEEVAKQFYVKKQIMSTKAIKN